MLLIMNNAVYILLLIQVGSGIEPTSRSEPKSLSTLDTDTLLTIEDISISCRLTGKCQLQCCQLYEIYSVAKRNCSTDIDGQLSAAKWSSPFSVTDKKLWQSVCRANISKSKSDLLTLPLIGKSACDDFVTFSLNYSQDFDFESCDPDDSWSLMLTNYSKALSILLMTSILIFYLMVPELHQKAQDKCFLFHLTSRLIIFCIYFIQSYSSLETVGCHVMAFVDQFFGLASAFWFNILCFHLWRSMNTVILSQWISNATVGVYSFYAWGCPFLVTGITHLLEYFLPTDYPFRPHIDKPLCLVPIHNDYSGSFWSQPIFIYYYSIILVLQIINLCAFINIVHIISSRGKFLGSNRNENHRHQLQKLNVFTYLKLFLLMGIMNMLTVTSYTVFGESSEVRMISSFFSSLNAVFVFLIIVCNKRVLQLAKKQFSRQLSRSQPTWKTSNVAVNTQISFLDKEKIRSNN